jgi:hypothetical protein
MALDLIFGEIEWEFGNRMLLRDALATEKRGEARLTMLGKRARIRLRIGQNIVFAPRRCGVSRAVNVNSTHLGSKDRL